MFLEIGAAFDVLESYLSCIHYNQVTVLYLCDFLYSFTDILTYTAVVK